MKAINNKNQYAIVPGRGNSFAFFQRKKGKGYYKYNVEIKGKMVNCCRINWETVGWYSYSELNECQFNPTPRENPLNRINEGVEIEIFGFLLDTKEWRCRKSGAVFELPFYCVDIDWNSTDINREMKELISHYI